MGRIKFVRVGNPFIAFLSIAIIALVLWLYVKCNPPPIQFRYNINDDSSGLIIHEYKATNGCSFVKEHNGLILHSAKRCKNSHFGSFYHWEDMANYRGTISFCPNCMKVELIQAYNDSVNSYR